MTTENKTALAQGSLMRGKKGIILGVANQKSIAWGIAKSLHEQGAEVALSYAGTATHKRVTPLAKEINSSLVLECDVSSDESIDHLVAELKQAWGKIDFIVHAVGFSDKNELKGAYVATSRQNFIQTLDISCYSFTALAQKAQHILNPQASLLTLSYFGAEKVMPYYNVMGVAKAALECSVRYLAADLGKEGIRVNAISAGPIKTLAASGISDFRQILKWNEVNAPLKRNTTIEEVGSAALYCLSDLSSGVTGTVQHVDSGYHIIGMLNPEEKQAIIDLLKDSL